MHHTDASRQPSSPPIPRPSSTNCSAALLFPSPQEIEYAPQAELRILTVRYTWADGNGHRDRQPDPVGYRDISSTWGDYFLGSLMPSSVKRLPKRARHGKGTILPKLTASPRPT